MRIQQIVTPGATEFDRKSQRIDAAALPGVYVEADPELVHVYGPLAEVPSGRYIAGDLPRKRRFAIMKVRQPERVIAPMPADGRVVVPEAVEERYFDHPSSGLRPPSPLDEGRRSRNPEPLDEERNADAIERVDAATADAIEPLAPRSGERVALSLSKGRVRGDATEGRVRSDATTKIVGFFARPSVANLVDQTRVRMARFRDDVDFHSFSGTPQPEDFDGCDAWIDPAVDEDDYDGFVAEAMVRGVSVVAARTAINVHRGEKGRTAFLVPLRDPNELTHAILAALFKPEGSDARRAAARQTISKFRPRQRARALAALYESLAPNPTR